jgi:hypothetical protein
VTTIASLAERARRLMLGTQRDKINVLTAAMTVTDNVVPVQLPTLDVTVGSAVEVDFEVMLVTAISGLNLSVLRGVDGSPPAVHALGAVVRIDPILSNWDLFVSMEEEAVDLSSPMNGLFQVITYEFVPALGRNYFNLVTDQVPLSVIRARQIDTTATWYPLHCLLIPGQNPVDFASTYALRLENYENGRRIRVWLRAEYGPITPTGNAEDAGLTGTAAGLLAIGAAYRMSIGREMARSIFERQGDTRRANEIQPGAQRQGLTPIAGLRAERISAERARLQLRWPGEGP